MSLLGHLLWWMMWVVHIVNDNSHPVKKFAMQFQVMGLHDGFVLDKVPNSCKSKKTVHGFFAASDNN